MAFSECGPSRRNTVMRPYPRISGQPAHISVTRRRSALPRWPSFASIHEHNDHLRERRWSSLTAGHSISTIQVLELPPARSERGRGTAEGDELVEVVRLVLDVAGPLRVPVRHRERVDR